MIVIITNSIALALDDPTAKSSNTALTELDFVFLLLYTTEMGFKILAYGFLLNKGSYLRDMWNILDFVIVFTA
jgi:voltage-dependent calcium channel R type alpha-1E